MPDNTDDRPVRRRPGGRSARVREAVLRATLEVLAERGYEATSFPEVARRAGVHTATVYRRWESKRLLVGEAMLARPDPLFGAPDLGSLRADLHELLRRFGQALREPAVQALVEVLVAGSSGPLDDLADVRGRFWERRFAAARPIVQRAIERSEVPADTDPDSVTELLVAPAFLRLFITGGELDSDAIGAITERVVTAFTAGRRASG